MNAVELGGDVTPYAPMTLVEPAGYLAGLDIEHIAVLVALLELQTVGEVLAVCRHIPDETVPDRARLLLDDLRDHA